MWLQILEDGRIGTIHSSPELLSDEVLAKGIIYNDLIPEPQNIPGKTSFLKYDTTTKKVVHIYVDRPLTPEEKIEQLESDLGNVLLENTEYKAKITELEIAQGNLLMEIALLKGGSI